MAKAKAPVTVWYHKNGLMCPDWNGCDTYEHYQEHALAQLLGLKPGGEKISLEGIGHSDEFESGGEGKPFNHEGPADFANVEHEHTSQCMHGCTEELTTQRDGNVGDPFTEDWHGPEAREEAEVSTLTQLCVQCHHRWFDHNTSVNGGGCRITGCDCTRYNDATPPSAQRDGNVGELIDGRVDVYGDPVMGFTRHAHVWSGILGIEVQPWQVALCMLGYKLVRTGITPDYSDNSDDIEGYLDIFRQLMPDMVQARDTAEYLAGGGQGARA